MKVGRTEGRKEGINKRRKEEGRYVYGAKKEGGYQWRKGGGKELLMKLSVEKG